jgi:hypothetical protein
MSLKGIASSMVGRRFLLDQQWRPYICLELECVSHAWLSKDSCCWLIVVGFHLKWEVCRSNVGIADGATHKAICNWDATIGACP